MAELLNTVSKITLSDGKPIEARYPNLAEDEKILGEVTARIRAIWGKIRDRTDVEAIWKRNDEIMRVKPDTNKKVNNRANVGAGEVCIAVNQLISMGYTVFTDNPNSYKYEVNATAAGDEEGMTIRRRNADILTAIFREIQQTKKFKRNLRRILMDVYKNGTAFAMAAMADDEEAWEYKANGRVQSWTRRNKVPFLKHIPLANVWVDDTSDDIARQIAVFIRDRKTWTELITDKKRKLVVLPEAEPDGTVRDACKAYRDDTVTDTDNAQQDEWENADRDLQDRTRDMYYKHYVVFCYLPIKGKTAKTAEWDEDEPERIFRVRFLGEPDSGKIIEIRESPYPGGMPVMVAHQSEDDIGMYHISMIEKCDTYHEQLCTSLNQLIDNRSKNVRRPVVYDVGRAPSLKKYDFGHSNAIPVDGNPQEVFKEMDIADMTGTIMASVQYNAQMIRLLSNTTDAVVGQAMGGRTSAAEYQGAKLAATTPIYADLSSIEDSLIVEFMRKLAMYVHRFMTHEDLIAIIGPHGFEFQFDVVGCYSVVARGVTDAMEKTQMIQNLLQLLGLTQDAAKRDAIMLRLAEAMEIENPGELVARPPNDQATKAALWENNEMLVLGEWDSPERGEQHDVHLAIHLSARFNAKQARNPNLPILDRHIQETEAIKSQEQAAAQINSVRATSEQGAPLPSGLSSEEQQAPGAGLIAGGLEGALAGSMNAGSPIPSAV